MRDKIGPFKKKSKQRQYKMVFMTVPRTYNLHSVPRTYNLHFGHLACIYDGSNIPGSRDPILQPSEPASDKQNQW